VGKGFLRLGLRIFTNEEGTKAMGVTTADNTKAVISKGFFLSFWSFLFSFAD